MTTEVLVFKLNNSLIIFNIAVTVFSISSHANKVNSISVLSIEDNIETIEVYAQKRAQKINDVAVAVTVVEGDTIEHWKLKDTTQLAGLVPNV